MYIFLFKKWAIHSFPLFWWVMWANCSGRSPKISDVSNWLRWLTKNEQPWVNRAGRSFFAKNKGFAQKTDEQIPGPATKHAVNFKKYIFQWKYIFSELQYLHSDRQKGESLPGPEHANIKNVKANITFYI